MSFFKLVTGGTVYSPEHLGSCDILIAGARIAAIGKKLDIPDSFDIDWIDAGGKSVAPGFIDLHVHITGGGGESGPATRLPEISVAAILGGGVTTVVGVLGTDSVTRSTENLVAKAQGLEQEGITAFALSGSYSFPNPVTLTGSVQKDICFIPQIIGVGELAISDHRGSHATFADFVRVVSDARVGGLVGNKPGLAVIHMGEGREGMEKLFRLVEETEIPITHLLPTHVTRSTTLFDQALRFASLGGNIDITAQEQEKEDLMSLAQALESLKKASISWDRVTVSSDANGSLPRFDEQGKFIGMGIGSIATLGLELQRLVLNNGYAPADALPLFTKNPAARLGLQGEKGALVSGGCADIIVFDREWQVDSVLAQGRIRVRQGHYID